jgi:cytidylate kinase
MNISREFGRCASFINSQFQYSTGDRAAGEAGKCAVAVSRQSGCGAHVFAEKVVAAIEAQRRPDDRPWAIFDRKLVEAVLSDHGLPATLERFMPEDRVSRLDDIIQDIFNLHPPTEVLVRQTAETILRLADLGNVIIVGRGANVIAGKLPHVISVRLIAPRELRISHMERYDKLTSREADERIEREDGGRKRYLKKYFNCDIDDPLIYDLVVNTKSVSLDEAARMVANLVHARQQEQRAGEQVHVAH